MAIKTFYDRSGEAVAYLDDDNRSIYLYDGVPVAWLSEGQDIYSYDGDYLGWFQDGWVRDTEGDCAFFTDDASGGPPKPPRQARPARGPREPRPPRAAREPRTPRPARSTTWSRSSNKSFFQR